MWLQGDNACKEVRNSFTGRWATLLCQANYFSATGHHHLEVGHTHEDIGRGSQNQFLFPYYVSVGSLVKKKNMLDPCQMGYFRSSRPASIKNPIFGPPWMYGGQEAVQLNCVLMMLYRHHNSCWLVHHGFQLRNKHTKFGPPGHCFSAWAPYSRRLAWHLKLKW